MTELRTKDLRAVFEALWARIAEAPGDEERHEKFIAYVAGNNLAKWAVDRYRDAERRGIIDAEQCARYRKEVAERAAAVVFFRAPLEKRRPSAASRYSLYVALVGLSWLAVGLITETAVWPGLMMTILGMAGFVAWISR